MRDAHVLFSARMVGQLPGADEVMLPRSDPVYQSGAVLGNSAIRRTGSIGSCSNRTGDLHAGWLDGFSIRLRL